MVKNFQESTQWIVQNLQQPRKLEQDYGESFWDKFEETLNRNNGYSDEDYESQFQFEGEFEETEKFGRPIYPQPKVYGFIMDDDDYREGEYLYDFVGGKEKEGDADEGLVMQSKDNAEDEEEKQFEGEEKKEGGCAR